MNSVITDSSRTPPEIKFPCLMEHIETGCIVLFVASSTGTCLYAGSSSNSLGYFLTSWMKADNPDFWKPFTKALTLQND